MTLKQVYFDTNWECFIVPISQRDDGEYICITWSGGIVYSNIDRAILANQEIQDFCTKSEKFNKWINSLKL